MSQSQSLPITTDPRHLEEILTQYLHTDEWSPIREYVANAHDACRNERDPCIRVWVDRDESAIKISDNGCGMTREVIIQAFTCMGGHLDQGQGPQVGRFGLGVLSAFIIAERLVVETRSLHEGRGWRIDWGRRAGLYTLAECDRAEQGTVATLHVDRDHRDMLRDRDIADYIQREMGLFTTPILVGRDSSRPANRHWRWLRDQAQDLRPRLLPLQEGRALLGTYSKSLNMLAVYGVFSPRGPSLILGIPDVEQTYNLGAHYTWFFCQGILIEENVEKYFPENLAFLVGLFDHPDFTLQITRERLIQDQCFKDLKDQVCDHVMEFLLLLARQDPMTLEKVLRIHRTMLLAYREKDKRLNELFREHYRFMSINGQLLWGEITTHCPPGQKTVYVLSESNPQLHLQDVARARGMLLVIATEVESQLLSDIADLDGYRIVDAALLMSNNGAPEAVPAPFVQLAGRLALPLSRHMIPRVRSTGSLQVDAGPAVLDVQGSDDGKMATVAGMFLNIRHPLIEALAMRTDLTSEMFQRAADLLYFIAVLNPQSHFQEAALAAASKIATLLGHSLERELALPEAAARDADQAQCFVAMPAEERFQGVWRAVHGVLGAQPYHWQVVKGADHVGSEVLKGALDQVGASRRFVADVSGLDDNVLLILGMMLGKSRDATAILCDKETYAHLPSKLKGTTCLVYEAPLRLDGPAMQKWFEREIAKHTRFVTMQGAKNATSQR